MPLTDPAHPAASGRLMELTHELLDAHFDTICMADDLPPAPEWAAHARYLKDLQRVAQRTLAELAGTDWYREPGRA